MRDGLVKTGVTTNIFFSNHAGFLDFFFWLFEDKKLAFFKGF